MSDEPTAAAESTPPATAYDEVPYESFPFPQSQPNRLATFAALTGQTLPAQTGPDSFNVLPALLGEKPAKPLRKHLVVQSGSNALAVRQGPWKFIPAQPGGGNHETQLADG